MNTFKIKSFFTKKTNKVINITLDCFLYTVLFILVNFEIFFFKILKFFFFIRIIFVCFYSLILVLLAISNLNFENIQFFFLDIFSHIHSTAYCSDINLSDVEMDSSISYTSSVVSTGEEIINRNSDENMSFSSIESDEVADVLFNIQDFDRFLDLHFELTNYPFSYFTGSPYLRSVENLTPIIDRICNENITLHETLDNIFYLINFRNLRTDNLTPLCIIKEDYLNLFIETQNSLDYIISSKCYSNNKLINIYIEKINNYNNPTFNNFIFDKILKNNIFDENIQQILTNFLKPHNSKIVNFFYEEYFLVQYLEILKNKLIFNSNLINSEVLDNTVNFITENQPEFDFELIDFQTFKQNNINNFYDYTLSELANQYTTLHQNIGIDINRMFSPWDQNFFTNHGFILKDGVFSPVAGRGFILPSQAFLLR